MNEFISKRKSIRKYEPTILDMETIEKIQTKINNLTPLYSNIQYSIEIITPDKNSGNMNVPYYLVFRSEKNDISYENIGFVGQQLNLYFAMLEVGACWKMSKPQEIKDNKLPYVISMTFGKSAEPLYRQLSEFDRKPLSEISKGDDDRLESARLAPSGLNRQNWYFISEKNKIHCYRKKLNFLINLIMNKLNCIDMGIALCHISEQSDNFNFSKDNTAPKKKNYIYTGTVMN